LRPFPRQQDCAAYLRALLDGSAFTRGYDPIHVQDAYTLRCMPQVHGAVRDAIAYARWAFAIELNAVTENPLLFIDARLTTSRSYPVATFMASRWRLPWTIWGWR
jgi:histidine ammonia-lyase